MALEKLTSGWFNSQKNCNYQKRKNFRNILMVMNLEIEFKGWFKIFKIKVTEWNSEIRWDKIN